MTIYISNSILLGCDKATAPDKEKRMKFILSLAFKNLTRYKRRTIITSFAIAIGLMMFILVDSLLIGVEQESVRNLKWYETSSARILHSQYWDQRMMMPLDVNIEDPDTIIAVLKENGIDATKRITFSADMILNSYDFEEDGNLGVVVQAVDLESDFDVFEFETTLEEGRFMEAGSDEIVIGSWFAEDIGAKVGSYITLITRGNGGFFEAMDLQIVGIVNCPNPNVNRSLVMMDITTAGEYLAMEDLATEIDIKLPEKSDTDEMIQRIAALLDLENTDYEIMSWEELAHDYLSVLQADKAGSKLILLLVFIIAAVGISNTMLMAMYERIRELGMMRALGMSDRAVHLSFMVEAGGIGLFGSVAGLLLGAMINIYLVDVGIDMSFMMRDMDIGYRIQSIMRGAWDLRTYLTALVSGVFLSMIVAYIPTRRALKMDIPACLHH